MPKEAAGKKRLLKEKHRMLQAAALATGECAHSPSRSVLTEQNLNKFEGPASRILMKIALCRTLVSICNHRTEVYFDAVSCYVHSEM